MKKILTIVLLMMSINTFSQLKVRGAFDYFNKGYNTSNYSYSKIGNDYYRNTAICTYGDFRIRLGADYKYKLVTVYFNQETYMIKTANTGVQFTPTHSNFFTGIKIEIKKDIVIKYEHLCMHPFYYDSYSSQQYGGYDMFSIGYGY